MAPQLDERLLCFLGMTWVPRATSQCTAKSGRLLSSTNSEQALRHTQATAGPGQDQRLHEKGLCGLLAGISVSVTRVDSSELPEGSIIQLQQQRKLVILWTVCGHLQA